MNIDQLQINNMITDLSKTAMTALNKEMPGTKRIALMAGIKHKSYNELMLEKIIN